MNMEIDLKLIQEIQDNEHIKREMEKKQRLFQMINDHQLNSKEQHFLEISKQKTVQSIEQKYVKSQINKTFKYNRKIILFTEEDSDYSEELVNNDKYNLYLQNYRNQDPESSHQLRILLEEQVKKQKEKPTILYKVKSRANFQQNDQNKTKQDSFSINKKNDTSSEQPRNHSQNKQSDREMSPILNQIKNIKKQDLTFVQQFNNLLSLDKQNIKVMNLYNAKKRQITKNNSSQKLISSSISQIQKLNQTQILNLQKQRPRDKGEPGSQERENTYGKINNYTINNYSNISSNLGQNISYQQRVKSPEIQQKTPTPQKWIDFKKSSIINKAFSKDQKIILAKKELFNAKNMIESPDFTSPQKDDKKGDPKLSVSTSINNFFQAVYKQSQKNVIKNNQSQPIIKNQSIIKDVDIQKQKPDLDNIPKKLLQYSTSYSQLIQKPKSVIQFAVKDSNQIGIKINKMLYKN